MQNEITKFKEIVKTNFRKEDFKYHEWIVEYHLDIVERIAMELCDIYKDADSDIVETLVWFHDFGKPIDIENERDVTRSEGPKVMLQCGFPQEFVDKVLEYWELMEKKNDIDLHTAPIEVQIISTADGCSHFTGVFYPSYFNEDGDNLIETQEHLREKIKKDWERKVVIPEAKVAFESHYKRALELLGEFPEKFIM